MGEIGEAPAVGRPDVVYIVRPGENNQQLRYSLRALSNLPHGRVWIVGYRPAWVSEEVGYIPTQQAKPKHANTWGNWRAAAQCDQIADEFILFNDDFFITRPIEKVEPLHAGLLTERMAKYRRFRLTEYVERATYTQRMLRQAGLDADRALSYELHVPFPVNRVRLLEGIKRLDGMLRRPIEAVSKRTYYGNTVGLGGTLARDVKVKRNTDGMPETPLPYLSTSPQSWEGLAGGWVRAQFPDVCRYERSAVSARPAARRTYRPGGAHARR